MSPLAALAVTILAGVAMVKAGLDRRMLALRPPVRRCGSCGRRLRRDACHHCR